MTELPEVRKRAAFQDRLDADLEAGEAADRRLERGAWALVTLAVVGFVVGLFWLWR